MLTKTELAKTKLEELCRELNKSNKEIQEKNHQKFKLLEEQHAQTVEKLRESLGDIKKTVDEKEEQSKKVADVEMLSSNLKQLSSEYEKRLGDLKKLVKFFSFCFFKFIFLV